MPEIQQKDGLCAEIRAAHSLTGEISLCATKYITEASRFGAKPGNTGQALGISGTLQPDLQTATLLWILPAFFTSIWLWFYAGSGFLLKAARHFDIGFDWFNRHFDIEKKPLQSIGLVAGALVAVVYWAVVVVGRWI